MFRHQWIMAIVITALMGMLGGSSAIQMHDEVILRFEDFPTGKTPQGWKVEGTNQSGPLAAWQVVAISDAPSQPNVLALTRVNHASRRTFNLCWTDKIKFAEGTLKLRFKAHSGEIDQGGGPIWRVRDKDNYYICRANPLESNFRLYYVKEGHRKQIASAEVDVPRGEWHSIEIDHEGNEINCSLNGHRLLTVVDDTFADSGGVGFWTKADAVTSFDDLVITKTNIEKNKSDSDS